MTRRNWAKCSTAGWCRGLRPGKSVSTCAWIRDMTMPTAAARWPDAGISRTSHTGATNPRFASIPVGEPIAGLWSERIAGTICFGGSRFATRSMPRTTLASSSWPAPSSVSGGPAHLDGLGTHSNTTAQLDPVRGGSPDPPRRNCPVAAGKRTQAAGQETRRAMSCCSFKLSPRVWPPPA